MIELDIMGPGWLMFFQSETDHNSWIDREYDGLGRKRREESEIIVLLTTIYESGTFN